MEQKFKGAPPRLSVVFQRFEAPLYFVTFNTLFRRPLLANNSVHAAFRNYAERGTAFSVGTGRYVLMPDHVHVFVRIGPGMTLRRWAGGLKQSLGKTLRALGHEPVLKPDMKLKSFWQPGFFDHLLRRDESYAQKWDYVWRNPVRAKLVVRPEEWPYQGEIHRIDEV
jgi:putative transposase